MVKRKEHGGRRCGKLTFIRYLNTDTHGNAVWELQCECGKLTSARAASVVAGHTISCGCAGQFNSRIYDPAVSSARTVWQNTYHCSMSFDTFYTLSQEACFYCGREPYRAFNAIGKRTGAYQKEFGTFLYNGIDRKDSSKSYIEGNMVPCCWDCNRMKGDMAQDKFIEHIKRIAGRM